MNRAQEMIVGVAIASVFGCGSKKSGAGSGDLLPPPDKGAAAQPEVALSFVQDIQPILVKSCSGCHTAGSKLPVFVGDEASFRGNGDRILATLGAKAETPMPPAKRRGPLTDAEQRTLRAFLATPAAASPQPPQSVPADAFSRDIEPILVQACGACHTPGSTALVFVGEQNLLKANAAAVLAAIDAGTMPPARTRQPLTGADKATLHSFLALSPTGN